MNKKAITLIATLISVSAFADLGSKAPLKADFRSMIKDTYSERNSLANGVNENIERRQKAKKSSKDSDSRRVTDFVDVEIGWGEAPKVVDRRFNSVEEKTEEVQPNKGI